MKFWKFSKSPEIERFWNFPNRKFFEFHQFGNFLEFSES